MVFLRYVFRILVGENNNKTNITDRLVNLMRLSGFIVVLIGPVVILQQFTRAESIAPIGAVWFADHTTVNRISTDSNTITQIIPVADKPQALAVDTINLRLWVLVKHKLLRFNPDSSLALELDLKGFVADLGKPKGLYFNDRDQTIWVQSEKVLLHLDTDGKLLHVWQSKDHIEAIGQGLGSSLWVVTKKKLVELSTDTTVLRSLELKSVIKKAKHIAVDSLGSVLWLASDKQLIQLNLEDINQAPKVVYEKKDKDGEQGKPKANEGEEDKDDGEDHPHKIRAITLDPQDGTLWLATKRSLKAFKRDSALKSATTLPEKLKKPEALVFEPFSQTIWVGTKDTILRVSPAGAIEKQIAVADKFQALATGTFTLAPTVSIVSPGDKTLTNNAFTQLSLRLAATCNGAECEVDQKYFKTLSLNATLNGKAIGNSFTIDGTSATHQPAERLPEGVNSLTVQATDNYGQTSGTVKSTFTVDTIAPQFLTLTPADGSTLTTATIDIKGQVNEPSANVLLLDAKGASLGLGTANFSFNVALQDGLNTFTLGSPRTRRGTRPGKRSSSAAYRRYS